MGNSGSIHNLNIEGATSELNSYFQAQSQPLRKSGNRELGYNYGHKNATSLLRAQPPRHSKDWRRSLANPCDLKEYNVGQDHPTQFKVLPKVNERLHLRATSNGAILFSGGTISGRKEERLQTTKSPSMPVAGAGMQRSRTFIYEPTKDNAEPDTCRPPEFHRSQTLLNIKVKADMAYLSANKDNNLKSMQKHTHSEPDFVNTSTKEENNSSLNKNGKVNKYNKKRRAPQAPTTDVKPSTLPIGEKNAVSTRAHITQNPQKQQLFTKNNQRTKTNVVNESNEVHVQARRTHDKKPLPPPPQPSAVSERTEALRTTIQTKIPYRREKSSDAILLRSQNDKLNFVESRHEPKSRTTPEPPRAIKTLEQRKSLDEYKTDKLSGSVEKTKIPQLKRTFYFGMDNAMAKTKQKAPAQTSEQRSVQKKPENNRLTSVVAPAPAPAPANYHCNEDDDTSASMPYIPNYDINIDKSDTPEDINDNGIMVHIRPTLPRRQLDTPTFNPISAWRSLVEDQENLQRRTIKITGACKFNDKRDGPTTGAKVDSPIQPKRMPRLQTLVKPSMLLNTWTPEQDLGDEDEENEAAVVVGEESSSDDCQSEIDGNGLLFYGSKMKKSEQYPKQVSSPVHLFSLSLPRDTHLDGIQTEKQTFNYSSLQKMDKISYSANKVGQQAPAGLRNTEITCEFGRLSGTKFDGSNNWLLHKNIAEATNMPKTHIKAPDDNNKNSYPTIEPMSLKFLTAGKHVMYLPCNYDNTKSSEAPKHGVVKDVPAQPNSQQRQSKRRQRELRENLQDPTPVFPANQHASSSDNDKPLHQRFTFQSTVRLLEKRRLADKLSKDAEIKEAQRKSELVALERVEEDFQRKRANEKANIRYQLRLYFGGNNEECKERYQSLPIANSQTINDYSNQQSNDNNNNYNENNNICCRDEPDGCVSTPQLGSSDNELGSKSSYAKK